MTDIQTFRLIFFLMVLVLMTGLESLWPRRAQRHNKLTRLTINLSMAALGSMAVKLMSPMAALGIALYGHEQGWGLIPMMSLPTWMEITLGVVILDAAIYAQHVAFHQVPALWRLHQVHHTDTDLDASSGIRFHPAEIILSMIYKMACVLLLGLSPAAVVLFEVILSTMAMFNHSNLRLPVGVDKALRYLLVTPDMHRIHHSVLATETNSNYGFNLAVWDKIFRTYTVQPRGGHHNMTLGLSEWQTPQPLSLLKLLILPFQRKT